MQCEHVNTMFLGVYSDAWKKYMYSVGVYGVNRARFNCSMDCIDMAGETRLCSRRSVFQNNFISLTNWSVTSNDFVSIEPTTDPQNIMLTRVA